MKLRFLFIFLFFLFTNFSLWGQSSFSSEHLKDRNWFFLLEKSSILIGSGKLHFFGIELYEAAFFSIPDISYKTLFDNNFALSIKYSKSFSKEKIAKRSKKEIFKLDISKEKDLDVWHDWMLAQFPNIKANDFLTAVFSPKFGLKLFYNNTLIASNDDINFAKAFLSIWLSPNTSEPGLRKQLFGFKN